MKKFTAIMMALGLTQCKPDNGKEGDTQNGSKIKVSCVVPMNKGTRSEFDNLMTDGSIKWSAGTERIYLAIPDETNPQIVEMTAFTTVESNVLLFEGEVAEGLLKNGEYDIWYLGNSKNLDIPYVTEEIENEVIRSISGSIASQSGDLEDLGYCHIAKTTVTAVVTENDEVKLNLNGTLKNQIAIAHLDLEGITQLKGDAIVGTEYILQYVDGAFEFAVTEDAKANINVTEGTTASYVVLFPNSTANVDLKSNTSKKVTFEGGVEANKIYYKHVSDMEFYPLTWEDYEEETNTINGHEYVDLGLPSGLLWATCNVGANSPEEYGDYFAWGETTTKSSYLSSNCPTDGLDNSQLQSQGYIDSEGNLTAQYDAATANWGGDWRMPTKAEQEELLNNCTWTWTTQNGVNGCKVTGPSGASIFLPAAGIRSGSSLVVFGSDATYWSSTPYEKYYGVAYNLYFDSVNHGMGYVSCYFGRSVRPVSGGNNVEPEEPEEPETPNANGHEYVDLGLPSGLLWATCNVGANAPEAYGNYYAWGETETKSEYTEENCPTYGLSISQLQSQGYIDGEGNLTAQHDAAAANWGGDWRMPTKDEVNELRNNCTCTWTTQNSVNGYNVEGPNGNSIFLPVAGYRDGSLLDSRSSGFYRSSTPYDGSGDYGFVDCYAYILFFTSDFQDMTGLNRCLGSSVRPVIKKQIKN